MSEYEAFAWAAGVMSIAGILGYYEINNVNKQAELEMLKARPQHELIVQDLNGDGNPERFYEINGKKFFLEIDGKNLEDNLE